MSMADIRCPMCGKNNPAERDTCQYCSARLKPLTAPQAQPPANSAPQENEPDWLASLRVDSNPDEISQASSFSGENEANDWLSRLGGDESAANSDSQVPDWLSTSSVDGNGLGWLSDQEEKAPESEAAAVTPVSDWLSSLNQDEETLPSWLSEEEPAAANDAFLTDSLDQPTETGEQAESEQADWQSASQADAETPDWLSELQSKSVPGPFTTQILRDIDVPAPDAQAQPISNPLPDWLSGLNAEGKEPASAAQEQDSSSPDWLARVRARRQVDQEQMSERQPGEEGGSGDTSAEMPDRLSGISTPKPAVEPGLDAGEAEQSARPTTAFTTPLFEGSGEDLDFGSSTAESKRADSPAGAKESQPPADETEMPDWLKSLSSDFKSAETITAVSLPEDIGREPGVAAQDTTSEPDWLAGLVQAGGSSAPGSSVPAFVGDIDELPIEEDKPPFEQTSSEENLNSIPDWISNVSGQDTTLINQPTSESGSVEKLEPANLPTWLEAMRPVEGVTLEPFQDTSDVHVESAGPLAGLRGALPADLTIDGIRTPPPYSSKISISDDIQNRLGILDSLILAENKPQTVAQPGTFSTHAILRLFLFVVFLAAVFLSLFLGPLSIMRLAPAAGSQAATDFQSQVTSLSSGTRVLLAVDYEPGYSAEMNTILLPVLSQLQSKNVFVSAVSTSVTGALLIEQARQKTVESLGGQPVENFSNLGYIPGGPAGLLAFAANPALLAPVDIVENKTWSEAGLNPQAGIDNFSVVIVATDNARTVGMWAEQMGPILQQKRISLLMISSAQSQAVIQPYYETYPRLVSGYLGGLKDADLYSRLSGSQAGDASLQTGYSALVLTAVLVILVGNLINFLAASYTRPKAGRSAPARSEVKA